jgi:hypothetical protein
VAEILDYVPRGDSWFLSTSITDQKLPKCEQPGFHEPESHVQESSFKALGSVASAPVDHRLIIRNNTNDEKELRSILKFTRKLRDHAGKFWIKDSDLQGNFHVYAFGELLVTSITPTSSGNFTSDAVEWPEPWHAHAVGHAPCHSCPPKIKAPWRRLMYKHAVSFLCPENR